MGIETHMENLETLLRTEEELESLPTREAFEASQERRKTMNEQWQAISALLTPMHQAMRDLPPPPDRQQILWAQTVLAMPNLAFMQIDTSTKRGEATEIIRFTLIDASGNTLADVFMKLSSQRREAKACQANGILPHEYSSQALDVTQAWERIQTAVLGKYIVSYDHEQNRKLLDAHASRHQLEPIPIIGEGLREHCRWYFNEDALLETMASRVGYPLPPAQNAIHRAEACHRIVQAIALGVIKAQTSQEIPLLIESDRPDWRAAFALDEMGGSSLHHRLSDATPAKRESVLYRNDPLAVLTPTVPDEPSAQALLDAEITPRVRTPLADSFVL